jgi:hypothetical protein
VLKRIPYIAYWGIVALWLAFWFVAFQRLSSAESGALHATPQSSSSASRSSQAQLPRGDAGHMYVEVPPEDVGHMYNAITEDENELRDLLVAIPVLLTVLVLITPWLLRVSVSEKVRRAVDTRVTRAEEALKKATENYERIDKKIDSKIIEERALLKSRLAYLHWSLGEFERATAYANDALEGARNALKVSSDLEKMRGFAEEVSDDLAYYLAEVCNSGTANREGHEVGRDRGVEMLGELTDKPAQPNEERVDTCLFVLWAFRDCISAGQRARAANLYIDWARALNGYRWKNDRQRANYEKYKAYYESLPAKLPLP